MIGWGWLIYRQQGGGLTVLAPAKYSIAEGRGGGGGGERMTSPLRAADHNLRPITLEALTG